MQVIEKWKIEWEIEIKTNDIDIIIERLKEAKVKRDDIIQNEKWIKEKELMDLYNKEYNNSNNLKINKV